jgi:hypothetical protein
MDWNKSYEQLMRLDGRTPYSCPYGQCNHVARSTFSNLVHYGFGSHHMNHRKRRKP